MNIAIVRVVDSTIEATCYILCVTICSINRSFRCMFHLSKAKQQLFIPVRVALIDQQLLKALNINYN